MHLAFRLDGEPVVVACADPAAAAVLASTFTALRVPPPRIGAPALTLTRAAAGLVLRGSAVSVSDALSFDDAIEAAEAAVAEALLRGVPHRIQLHAGGAVVRGRAALVLGPPEAGKSSLTFAWHRAGFAVLGDDVILVDEAGRAAPFPRLFKVHPAALARAGIAPDRTLLWRQDCVEAWYDPGPGAWADRASVGLLALVRRVPAGPAEVTPLAPAEALAALLESALPSGRTGREAFDALHALAGTARAVRLVFSDADDGARVLAALLP